MTLAAAQPEAAPADIVATSASVRCVGLGKIIDDRDVLNHVSFELEQSSFVALLGANGAGKTTLLHTLAMLSPYTSGELFLFDQLVQRANTALRARVGLIGHQPMLYRDLTAIENLVFFGKLYDVADPTARAEQLLDRVGLLDRSDDPPKAFSRGMQQRLAIARALMHDPDLLLADEPFSGLDLPSIDQLEAILAQLHDAGKTIVVASHDVERGLRIARRAIVLRRGHLVVDKPAADLDVQAVREEVTA